MLGCTAAGGQPRVPLRRAIEYENLRFRDLTPIPPIFEMREDDLTGEATRGLLALHLAGMNATSPPGHVFALDLSGLQAPGVTVWSAWDGMDLTGIGALKALDPATGEV